MGANRVLLLEGTLSVSVDTGRLVVARKDQPKHYLAPKDVAAVVIDSPAVTITSSAMRILADAGAVTLLTDERHMPLAQTFPNPASTRQVMRLRQQIEIIDSEYSRRLWQQVVVARITSQAHVLRRLGRKGALYLERMAAKVKPGDSSNHEAQAAKHFWRHLWPDGFTRAKQGADDPVNSRLNYGYAVVRSMVARALVAAGFNPALGLGHCSENNPFNLADDLLEPYRFVAELQAAEALQEADGSREFDSADRLRMAQCVSREILLSGQSYRLAAAIDETIASLARCLDAGKDRNFLALPQGLSA